MQFQAPQSNVGGGSQLAAMLLQLSASQSAQAASTIDSIGARLMQIAEAKREREFILGRDEASRKFAREQDRSQQAFTLQRDMADRVFSREQMAERQSFEVKRDEAGQAFQMLLEEKRHELGQKDIETRAALQAKAELEQAQAQQQAEAVQQQRVSELVRLVPDLVQRREEPAYMLVPRFAKVGDGGDAFERLSAQLQADGHSSDQAAEIARSLMRPVRYEWVDRRSFSAAQAALTRAGDDAPETTLRSLVGELSVSEVDARRSAERHINEIVGGRIGSIERSLAGTLETPGAQPGRFTPQPISVVLGGLNVTPDTLGEDLANQWRTQVGAGWQAATLRPEFSPQNWVTQPDGSVRPREGLDQSTLSQMREGSPAHQFWSAAVQRMPASAAQRQGSTSATLTATQLTKGAPGEGGPGAKGSPAATTKDANDFREASTEALLNIGPFRQQFGDVQLPNF